MVSNRLSECDCRIFLNLHAYDYVHEHIRVCLCLPGFYECFVSLCYNFIKILSLCSSSPSNGVTCLHYLREGKHCSWCYPFILFSSLPTIIKTEGEVREFEPIMLQRGIYQPPDFTKTCLELKRKRLHVWGCIRFSVSHAEKGKIRLLEGSLETRFWGSSRSLRVSCPDRRGKC